ncbi:hypothetical protein F753_12660 [Stutzerimonas chloritidismutans AW-1]|uniref:Uncharacterized protein n=1 Tax=Stutzerimonas chloritidismutans AW-1 TaxID=1263865 RepID=V4S0Z7_STUCH|nr:hypothetical protein F753_12660 [Stutzerimonas chloritidismutans AW-1]
MGTIGWLLLLNRTISLTLCVTVHIQPQQAMLGKLGLSRLLVDAHTLKE